MPRQSDNPTREDRQGKEFDLGSLPLGSVFDCYSTSGEFVAMGILMDVSEYSGRCEVQLIREGDGNFTGDEKEGTLRRIHSLSEVIIFNHKHPVGWHGVDDDVRREILDSKQLYEQAKHLNLEKGKAGEDEQEDVRGQEATQEVGSGQGGGTTTEIGATVEQGRTVTVCAGCMQGNCQGECGYHGARYNASPAVSLTKFDEESEVEEG